MLDRQNTINGWVLSRASLRWALRSIVTGEIFHSERPEKMGYPIEGVAVEGEGGEAEKPVAFYLATATLPRASGLQEVRRLPQRRSGRRQCPRPGAVRHDGQAPRRASGLPLFRRAEGRRRHQDWDKMSAWLANPKKFAPGTKMTLPACRPAGPRRPDAVANARAGR